MRVNADTNVLVRAVVQDDKTQAERAIKLLKTAEVIAVSLPALCEFVWVLGALYQFTRNDIIAAVETLVASENVLVNRPAVELGLTIYMKGGDFADGVIAYEGSYLGGKTFVSFDKKAVSLLTKSGYDAFLLS